MLPTVQSKSEVARPVLHNSPYDYINNLQQFNPNPWTDSIMDQARAIVESGNYYHQTIGFPDISPVLVNNTVQNFVLGQTRSGTINIPPYSYLLSIACYCAALDVTSNGFRVRIFDKGTKTDLFDRQYGIDRLLGSNQCLYDTLNNLQIAGCDGITVNNPFSVPTGMGMSSAYSIAPLIITPPGVLQIDMTNIDTNADGIYAQIVFGFAVPINNENKGITVAKDV